MDNFLINVHILVGYEALVENPTYAQRKTFKVAKKTYQKVFEKIPEVITSKAAWVALVRENYCSRT